MAEQPIQKELFDDSIIPSRLAIRSMRDSGYKNTAYALAELIDNSQQAGATVIEVLCLQTRELIRHRERARISQIGVLDNGGGMEFETLHMALQFGNGSYLKDRSGIGRFGMGLPNASISQAAHVDIWTWQNGPDNALYSYLDVPSIESGDMQRIPEPQHSPLPVEWREISQNISKTGTLVVWSNLDIHRLTWKSARATLINTERLAGRIYRRFIQDGTLRIRLYAQEETGELVYDKEATHDDPLYLSPSPLVPSPFDAEPMFERVFSEDLDIEFNGDVHTVHTRYSVAGAKTVELSPGKNRGATPYGQHAAKNIGLSVVRAGRELMLDQGWCIGYDPRERWWGAEVEFPPALDEVFGVTNNKQAATHLAELASMEWEQLREDDEDFRDVVERLKEEGDPRGYLLPLQDSITRNLNRLREVIEGQGKGARSTRRSRHDDPEPDPATNQTEQGWRKRSEERPIPGENDPRTEDDFQEIKDDLAEKEYPDEQAEALLALIRDADLHVVFLEADFTNSYELFNVEIKGNLTEVTFNRQHPAFSHIFGTVNTADEDLSDIPPADLLQRLLGAANGAKVLFGAWARYEREAGVDRARDLARIRFAWGQIAANFLDPEHDV